MQIFEFMKLREEAEKSIIPRGEDPMKRLANRRAESIPSFSQNVNLLLLSIWAPKNL